MRTDELLNQIIPILHSVKDNEQKLQRILDFLLSDICEESNDENEIYHEEINGFYNDDGTKVDIASVPVPGLCVICKSYQIEDWEENLLCLMNRNDQRNENNFKCGAFEKI